MAAATLLPDVEADDPGGAYSILDPSGWIDAGAHASSSRTTGLPRATPQVEICISTPSNSSGEPEVPHARKIVDPRIADTRRQTIATVDSPTREFREQTKEFPASPEFAPPIQPPAAKSVTTPPKGHHQVHPKPALPAAAPGEWLQTFRSLPSLANRAAEDRSPAWIDSEMAGFVQQTPGEPREHAKPPAQAPAQARDESGGGEAQPTDTSLLASAGSPHSLPPPAAQFLQTNRHEHSTAAPSESAGIGATPGALRGAPAIASPADPIARGTQIGLAEYPAQPRAAAPEPTLSPESPSMDALLAAARHWAGDREGGAFAPRGVDQGPSAPDLHINIGRIEIKPPAAPQPKLRPRAVSLALPLDDYLRNRGGQRR